MTPGVVGEPTSDGPPADRGRLLGRCRVTDASAFVGTGAWIGFATASAAGPLDLGTVELFVCFATLVLVPLGLGLVEGLSGSRGLSASFTAAVYGQFPAAVLVAVGLARPVGTAGSVLLVLPWLAVTGAIALVGFGRLLARGSFRPLPELAIDAALCYLPVAAIALVGHRSGVTLYFPPIIVLLTAVHFHYAGFVLPLIVGLAGRRCTGADGRLGTDRAGRVAALATAVLVVNVALVAVGIAFSPVVEVVAVALLVAAVLGFAAVTLGVVVPGLPRLPGALLASAALSLFVTMAFALAYGYSAFPGTDPLVTIGEMIRWHGTLNAVGFALPGLLAFRLLADPG